MLDQNMAEIALHLIPLPALTDNYIWLVHDNDGMAIVVDPGEADVVEQALAARNLQLRAILLTHHHDDHIGGVAELRGRHDVPVYAPVDERIVDATIRVREDERVDIAAPRLSFEVLAIPGHTLSHVAYVGDGLLFCGDTLFSMGCGRMFEGTAEQMLHSLDRLAALPDETRVCGGHEYTQTNGRFAITVEPENRDLQQRLQQVAALRAQGLTTLPISMTSERSTNPFLRVNEEAVIDWCRAHGTDDSRVARFATLRGAKDAFR
jgi:hydroxyacylglutathione hydrolase